MKKIYIAPKIDVIILNSLCSGGFLHGSVHRGSLNDVCISKFDVVGEEKTKIEDEYTGLWGKSNSDKWGDD